MLSNKNSIESTLKNQNSSLYTQHYTDKTLYELLLIEIMRYFSSSSSVASSVASVVDGGDAEESSSSSFERLEAIGYRVGTKLIQKLTKDRTQLFTDNLDRMKFLCKDVYVFLYDKQVDNLRTNHKGMYVVQDNSFRYNYFSSSCLNGMALHCGVLRGCLDILMGCPVTVLAETGSMPQVTFKFELLVSK